MGDEWQTRVSYGVAFVATAFFLAHKPWERKEEKKKAFQSAGMTISRLTVYPVKSMGGCVVNEWGILPQGLLFDRRWMVVREEPNSNGVHRKVSQREHPIMATITPEIVLDENKNLKSLTLHMRDEEPLVVPHVHELKVQKCLKADIWGNILDGVIDLGDNCAQWCSKIIGVKCRLVYGPDELIRKIEGVEHVNHVKSGEKFHDDVWLADGFPYLLLTEELVEWCNKDCLRTDDIEIKASRFRPNILINGSSSPVDQDTWRRVVISRPGASADSGVVLDICKPCTRCSMPGINQETGRRTRQPRPWMEENRMGVVGGENSTCFGVNAIQMKTEKPQPTSLRVGDQITVLIRGEGLKPKQEEEKQKE